MRPDFSAFLLPWHPFVKVWRRNKRVWMKRQLLSVRQAWSRRGDGNLPNYFSYDNRDAEDWSPAPVPAASSPHCSCMHTKRMTSPHTHTYLFQAKPFFQLCGSQGVDVDVECFPIVLHNGEWFRTACGNCVIVMISYNINAMIQYHTVLEILAVLLWKEANPESFLKQTECLHLRSPLRSLFIPIHWICVMFGIQS